MRSPTPSRVLVSHLNDQFLEVGMNSRPSSGLRFPPLKKPKASPIRVDEGARHDDGRSLSPREESGKQNGGELSNIQGSSRLDLALDIQIRLVAEENL